MSEQEDIIIEFLAAKARAAWEDQQPYLLSFAGPDLTEGGIDYREILQGEKLKTFVERTAGENRYRVVRHSQQKAKIGLVPHDENFEFEDIGHEEAGQRETGRGAVAQGNPLLDFLHALSRLPAEDIDGVVIPTRVLVKLARKK